MGGSTKSEMLRAAAAFERVSNAEMLPIPPGWSKASIPRPEGWKIVREWEDALMFRSTDGLLVQVSASMELDEKAWLHVSYSRRDKIPNWFDTKRVKSLFIGDDKTALCILPSKDKFVNIRETCLHLWHCLDGDVTPDFTHGTGSI